MASTTLGGYAAAKAGVINLMETVALEYGPHGHPGQRRHAGPDRDRAAARLPRRAPGGVTEHVRGLDLQRLSMPEEVANTVLWLASDDSSNITGICVRSNIRLRQQPALLVARFARVASAAAPVVAALAYGVLAALAKTAVGG